MEDTSLIKYKYVWRIPSLTKHEKELLCYGFVKNYCNGYVPRPLILLVALFYTNDQYLLNEIQSSPHTQCFHSPVFMLCGFKWYVELFPNGSNDYNEGKVMLYICLISNPPKIGSISCEYKIQLKETNTEHQEKSIFNHNDRSYSGWSSTDALEFNKLKSLNTITISIGINVQCINFKHKNDILYPSIGSASHDHEIYIPSIRYTWNITNKTKITINDIKNAVNGDSFYSNPFETVPSSLKWRLDLCPMGNTPSRYGKVGLFLHLISLPAKISQICVKYHWYIPETNTLRHSLHDFNEDSLSWGKTNLFAHHKTKDLKQLTIHLQLMIIDIYYTKDIDKPVYVPQINIKQITLPSSHRYIWKVNQMFTMHQLQFAKNKSTFASPIFEILNSIKWCLELHPNGNVSDKLGSVCLYLRLMTLPPKISQISALFILTIKETNSYWEATNDFNKSCLTWGWGSNQLKTIHIQQIDALNIDVQIIIIDMFDIDGNCIQFDKYNQYLFNMNTCNDDIKMDTFIPKELNTKAMKHQWIMKSATDKGVCHSPPFSACGLKWQLQFESISVNTENERADLCENDKDKVGIYLYLLSLPVNIDKITVRYSLSIIESESDNIRNLVHDFIREELSWGNSNFCLPIEKNKNSNKTMTIGLEMLIVCVYDKNGNELTHKFRDDNDKDNSIKLLQLPNPAIFEWKINDLNTLNRIKKAGKSDIFFSKIFNINSFKFDLMLYPNGENNSHSNSNRVSLYLRLMSLPPQISRITVMYKLIMKETDSFWSTTQDFYDSHLMWGWNKKQLKTIDIADLDSITIKTEIVIMEIYDINGNNMMNLNNINNRLSIITSIAKYKWNICNNNTIYNIKKRRNVYQFSSPIISANGLKYYIGFWSNGSRLNRIGSVNLFLNIISFKSFSISYIIRFRLYFVESGKNHCFCTKFTATNTCSGSIDWGLTPKDIYNLKTFNILTEVILVDVYENNKIITKQYVNNNNNNNIPKILNNISSEVYVWKIWNDNILNRIKISLNGEGFCSNIFNMFGMKWFLQIYPNGKCKTDEGYVNISLHVDVDNLDIIICGVSHFYFKETNTKLTGVAIFNKQNTVKSWGKQRISNKTIKMLNEITITLKFDLMDVYDTTINNNQSKNITKQFMLNYVNQYKEIDNTFKNINDGIDSIISIVKNDLNSI